MSRFSKSAVGLSLLAVIAVAGCPLLDDLIDDDDPIIPTTVVGTWSGVLTGSTTKTIEGIPGAPLPGTRSVTIKFGSDFAPTSLPIWGFNLAFDQITTKNQVDQAETFEYGANQPPRDVTLVATIRETTYTENNVRVVMDLEYSATGASIGLTEEGTGTMTIEAEIDGNSLSFNGIAVYTVESSANAITTTTSETSSFTGTLSK